MKEEKKGKYFNNKINKILSIIINIFDWDDDQKKKKIKNKK